MKKFNRGDTIYSIEVIGFDIRVVSSTVTGDEAEGSLSVNAFTDLEEARDVRRKIEELLVLLDENGLLGEKE